MARSRIASRITGIRRSGPALALAALLAACGAEEGIPEAGDGRGDSITSARPSADRARLERWAAELEPYPEGLECEREGYPCSWAESAEPVFVASLELGEATMARIEEGSLDAAESALREDPRVVEVTTSDRALAFRLEGGRRIWVLPSDTLDLRGSGAPRPPRSAGEPFAGFEGVGASLLPVMRPAGFVRGPEAAPETTRLPEVLGEDTDGDGKVNQRDRRRALVLDPFFWEFSLSDPDYAEGAEMAAILEGSGLYDVDLRLDEEAGVDAFRGWEAYDAIHLGTHGTWGLTFTGEVFDASDLDAAARARAQSELASIGVDLVLVSKKDKKKDLDAVDPAAEDEAGAGDPKARPGSDEWIAQNADFWSLGLTGDFFRDQYPQGLGRSIVVFNSCRSYSTDVVGALLPVGRPPADQAAIFAWDETVETPDAVRAARTLWSHLVEDKVDAYEAFWRLERAGLNTSLASRGGYADGTLALYPGRAHRAVEIVTLLDASGRPLDDGADLEALLDGEVGDGEEDRLEVRMRIEGVTGSAFIDNASSQDERPFMEAWLELDGRQIGAPEGLLHHPVRDGVVLIDFEDVPLGLDVESGRTYELEAVVRLPEEEDEGGFSRYSVRLGAEATSWATEIAGGPGGGAHAGYDGQMSVATRSGRQGSRTIEAGQVVSLVLRTQPGDGRVPLPGSCPMIRLQPVQDGVRPRVGSFSALGSVTFADCEGGFGNLMDATGYELGNGSDRPEAPGPVTVTIEAVTGNRVRGTFAGRFHHARDQAENNYIEYERQYAVSGRFSVPIADWP